jgi:hypothetical protein
MGVLLIWCPASGRAFSTGIETDARSFASLPNNPGRAKCPHCGEVHVWWKDDAWLRADGEGDLPPVFVGPHLKRPRVIR